MKAKPMYSEDEKAVSQMIENGYVMEDNVVKSHLGDAERVERIKNAILDNTEIPDAVANPDLENAELAIPYNTPPKEIKLHMTSLKVLTAELEHIRKSFSNKNGGMRGIPKSVRNRIDRLEKVISFKTEVYKRALEKSNELGRISEDT